MKLVDLLKNYKPVYPQSQQWEDTFTLFEQNPTDKEIITQLIEEHNRDGKFREPIILSTPEEDTDEDTGEYQPHIKNGTHRVYVTHLLGLENAQTHYGWPDTPNPHTDENGYPYTVTHYSYTTNQHETPDTETDIFDYLRSIKINDTLWVTSDYMTLTNDHQGSIYWSQPITTPNLIQQLHTQINHKIRNTHISSINLNTQTIHNEQEEQQLHNK